MKKFFARMMAALLALMLLTSAMAMADDNPLLGTWTDQTGGYQLMFSGSRFLTVITPTSTREHTYALIGVDLIVNGDHGFNLIYTGFVLRGYVEGTECVFRHTSDVTSPTPAPTPTPYGMTPTPTIAPTPEPEPDHGQPMLGFWEYKGKEDEFSCYITLLPGGKAHVLRNKTLFQFDWVMEDPLYPGEDTLLYFSQNMGEPREATYDGEYLNFAFLGQRMQLERVSNLQEIPGVWMARYHELLLTLVLHQNGSFTYTLGERVVSGQWMQDGPTVYIMPTDGSRDYFEFDGFILRYRDVGAYVYFYKDDIIPENTRSPYMPEPTPIP